jgi:hypothetical protein
MTIINSRNEKIRTAKNGETVYMVHQLINGLDVIRKQKINKKYDYFCYAFDSAEEAFEWLKKTVKDFYYRDYRGRKIQIENFEQYKDFFKPEI